MKHKTHFKLFGLLFDDKYPDGWHRILRALITILISILPYGLIKIVWYRIIIYYSYYKFIPVNLLDIQNDLDNHNIKIDIWEIYEVDQLNQY